MLRLSLLTALAKGCNKIRAHFHFLSRCCCCCCVLLLLPTTSVLKLYCCCCCWEGIWIFVFWSRCCCCLSFFLLAALLLVVLVLLTTSVLKQREVPATVSSFYVSVVCCDASDVYCCCCSWLLLFLSFRLMLRLWLLTALLLRRDVCWKNTKWLHTCSATIKGDIYVPGTYTKFLFHFPLDEIYRRLLFFTLVWCGVYRVGYRKGRINLGNFSRVIGIFYRT